MKNWKPIVNWEDIKVGDELQWESSASGINHMVKIQQINDEIVKYRHDGFDYKKQFTDKKFGLSRGTEQEIDMVGRWVPVGADEIKVGDRLQVRVRVDKGDSDWEGIGTVESVGDLGIHADMTWYPFTRTFQRLAREDTDTEMYNVWNKEGVWQGAKRARVGLRIPGWRYERIEESEYPSVPIESGVYRVQEKDYKRYLMDRADGKWFYSDGVESHKNFTIIQKYKEVKNEE